MNLTEKHKENQQIVELLFQLGTAYLQREDYDNAIDRFKKIIELGEEDAKTYLNLSKAYIIKEQFDYESQKIFEKTLDFDPENPVLNVVLSQLYFDAAREDEQALKVYEIALKHNPPNADLIITKLLKISLQQDNIDKTRELMHRLLDFPQKAANLLHLYIVNEWKHQGFNHISRYLQLILKIQEELSYYRWYIVNLLQAQKQLSEKFKVSREDLEVCYKYLTSTNTFDRLIDIYLYPTIVELLVRYTEKAQPEESNSLEEYEIFLTDNSFTNIWDKALSKNNKSRYRQPIPPTTIWKKLNPFPISEHDTNMRYEWEADGADSFSQLLSEARALMIARLKGVTTNQIIEGLTQDIKSIILKTGNNLPYGFHSSDGLILFWKNIHCPIQMALDFLQQHPEQNGSKSVKMPVVHFLIHKFSPSTKFKEKNLIDDMLMALSTFQLEREIFFQDHQSGVFDNKSIHQLVVTSSVQEELDGEHQFILKPIELTLQHPQTQKNIQLYQLICNDAFYKIRSGEIQNINQFHILKELHTNPVFASFKAIDSFLDRLVVIKILQPDFKVHPVPNSTPDLFFQEAKTLGKLSHSNIAMVYDIGLDHDFCFITREYIEGESLKVQWTMNQRINWIKTLKICLNIAQTLHYAHTKNMFHGRLQPNNIFILENDDVKITDFQITSFSIPLKSYQASLLKSLTYSAPEQIDNKSPDYRTDIFSLGVIMYEVFTDCNPFLDEDRETILTNILYKNPEPLSSLNPEVPMELSEIISKAIEKSPLDRFQSMEELENQLLEIMLKFGS